MIGVVGGMGPHAGLDLVRKVLNETLATRDQDHLPLVLISLPSEIPDRTRFLLGEERENPALAISRILMTFETMGVTVAGIPCNTTHAPTIFDGVRACLAERNSRLSLLDMVEETVRFATENLPPGSRVGVLGTHGTYRAGTYRDAFRNSSFSLVPLEESEMTELVHLSIYHPEWGIKARPHPVSSEAKARLTEACRRLESRGANAVVLGCTELPLALPSPRVSGLIAIDPGRALARALIRSMWPEKLKPLTPSRSLVEVQRTLGAKAPIAHKDEPRWLR